MTDKLLINFIQNSIYHRMTNITLYLQSKKLMLLFFLLFSMHGFSHYAMPKMRIIVLLYLIDFLCCVNFNTIVYALDLF
jgi:hypothetical protein